MFTFDSTVRYSETDENGCLTMTALVNYLQDTCTMQSDASGCGNSVLAPQNLAWFLLQWDICINRMPEYGEKIQVSTLPYAFKGMYGYRKFWIKSESGEELVTADSAWFLFDVKKQRPCRVPEELIARYQSTYTENEKMQAASYSPLEHRRASFSKELGELERITVEKTHLDSNHHVNNAKYVEMASAALGISAAPERIRVVYKKAAVLGDVICVRSGMEENECAVELCAADGETFAALWIRF